MGSRIDEVGSLEITSYDWIDGNIVITKVKVLDKQGKYIKFAKLKEVEPYLSLYNVNFKNKKND